MHSLDELREDFERQAKRSISLPFAGAMVWLAIGIVAYLLPPGTGTYVLLFGSGAIFPLGMAIARLRGEALLSNSNPLAMLLGACVFMVNLLWAVHIPLAIRAPEFVPLSVGIGLGLHWVVYSWITRHPVGHIHAAARTVMVLVAWWFFPGNAITACAVAVVLAYAVSVYLMATRPIPAITRTA